MSTPHERGLFIVIEGLDRSGKSTQAASLLSSLQLANIPAELIKFPDRTTPIGMMIDGYLRSQSDIDDRAIHLLFSANRWELASKIEQTLSSGTTLISDRYAFSGVAFSTAKGLPLSWCKQPDVGLPSPDLTLFLDISPEKARLRGGYGEERYEKEEMQRRVREIFTVLEREQRQRKEGEKVGKVVEDGMGEKGRESKKRKVGVDVDAEDEDEKKKKVEVEEGGEAVEGSGTRSRERESGEGGGIGRSGEGLRWVTIDAGQTLDEVRDAIWKEVEPLLSKRSPNPLHPLWISH